METELGVVVGNGQGTKSQEKLAEAISFQGFICDTVDIAWPRDHYVFHNERYIARGVTGSENYNPFGEGGYVIPENGYVVLGGKILSRMHTIGLFSDVHASEEIRNFNTYQRLSDHHTGLFGEEKRLYAENHLLSLARAEFSDGFIYPLPGGSSTGMQHKHVDMISLSLPSSKLFIIDSINASFAAESEALKKMSSEQGVEIVNYYGSSKPKNPDNSGDRYHLNCLVLQKDDQDMVFVNSNFTPLISLFEKRAIPYTPVDIERENNGLGGIRCQTNIYKRGDNVELLWSPELRITLTYQSKIF